MLSFIILLTINSLICLGFWHACDFNDAEEWDELPDNDRRKGWARENGLPVRRMILWRLRWWGGQYLPPVFTKPLYRCLTCMASIHSIGPFLIFYTGELWHWPFYVLGLAGLNSLTARL